MKFLLLFRSFLKLNVRCKKKNFKFNLHRIFETFWIPTVENDLRDVFGRRRFDVKFIFLISRFLLISSSKTRNNSYDRQKFEQSFFEKGSRGSSTILSVASGNASSCLCRFRPIFTRLLLQSAKEGLIRSKNENVDVVG